MTNDAHANHVPTYALSPEQLDKLFERTTASVVSERDAGQRAEAWPRAVEQALLAAATRARELEARVTALEAGRG